MRGRGRGYARYGNRRPWSRRRTFHIRPSPAASCASNPSIGVADQHRSVLVSPAASAIAPPFVSVAQTNGLYNGAGSVLPTSTRPASSRSRSPSALAPEGPLTPLRNYKPECSTLTPPRLIKDRLPRALRRRRPAGPITPTGSSPPLTRPICTRPRCRTAHRRLAMQLLAFRRHHTCRPCPFPCSTPTVSHPHIAATAHANRALQLAFSLLRTARQAGRKP